MRIALSMFMATSLLAACGDDDGGGNTTPDASTQMPDAASSVCTAVTSGTIDFRGRDESNAFIAWDGDLSPQLPGGTQQFYQIEFYDGIEPSLTGTFDLASGNQSNYSTCAVCIRAFVGDAQNNITKVFFQKAGTITTTQDPYSTRHLIATVSGLELQEVTIDQDTFVSTPVAGGVCASFANYSIDRTHAPASWTCAAADYDGENTCNCECGAPDPDCYTASPLPLAGCTTQGDVCFNGDCVAPPANDTCQTATPITIGNAVTGTTAGANNSYDAGLDTVTCTDVAQRGGDVAYSVTLAANQQITVTLSGLGPMHDGSISLLGPGNAGQCDADPITTCVKGSDTGGDGENDTFQYTTDATNGAGTYYIIVDGYGVLEGGPFTLTVTSP